jgi:NADH-quinone oxidoreductase subunit N
MKALFIISALGILAMLAEIFKFKKILYPVVLLGILIAYAVNFLEWGEHNLSIPVFDNMIHFNNVSLAFSSVILATAFFWFILANDYFNKDHVTDHYALVLFALVGALILTAFRNLTTLFLGIEILSIPLYVLAASRKRDLASNEAGFKYLIMGSFASGFLLFGIALIYGATGSFDLMTIKAYVSQNMAVLPAFFYAGVLLILVAMLFKVSAAPFHFWAPDVYEGSPTVITALMSTIVKTAAFIAFINLFLITFNRVNESWNIILAAVISLSLLISNITAATQQSVKRMLAYSSISHAAFMLMVILSNSGGMSSVNAILYYSLAYSIGSITAFTVLYNISKQGNDDANFAAFNGLAKRHPLMAFCMTVSMLSLAGIPITSGFFAKYFVFSLLIGTSFNWLIILAILTSAIGVYYYFKVIIAMYFKIPEKEGNFVIDSSHAILLIFTTLFTMALGLVPNFVIGLLG